MPGVPTRGDVHVNRPLTSISIAYAQDADKFIASRVFPSVPVEKQSDRYFFYDKGDWLRNDVRKRGPNTESAGGGFRVDNTPTYFAETYAVHKDIDDQLRANVDDPLNIERDATLWVTQQLLQKRDIEWASNFFSDGIWGIDDEGKASSPSAGEFLQFDQAASAPIVDMRDRIVNQAAETGYKVNIAVIGARVWKVLSDHEDFLERIKYTQGPAIVTPRLLAQVLELDDVMISWAVLNSGAAKAGEYGEGGSTSDDIDFIFPDAVGMFYRPASAGLLQPSAGYTFSWTGFLAAGPQGNRIRSFRMEHLASDRIEGEMAFDMKVISSDLGIFMKDAVG